MAANLQHFFRAIGLVWGRMGPARLYVLLASSALIGLATVGVWQRCFPGKQVAQPADRNTSLTSRERIGQTSATPALPPSAASPADSERLVAITELTQTKKRGRHGEHLVVANIGLTPRPKAVKGEVVIHVFFFDVTRNNEIRPTEAQVTFEWITPARDWNDPTTKYLAATYVSPRVRQRWSRKLRYGGFAVRAYVGDKLQDERSEPEGLLSALRNAGQSGAPQTSGAAPIAAESAAASEPLPSPTIAKTLAANSPVSLPTPSPAETPDNRTTALPHGKPVPGKAGFVSSPFDSKFIIDVRGFPPGTLVNDPNTDKTFRVP